MEDSPKKAEKLAEIQAALDSPELKTQKPSDTRWLARERCVRAVRKSLPATFQEMYDESGDAEVYGLIRLFCKYKSVACLYMLCDVLHTLAKLQGSLQSQSLNLACVPGIVEGAIARLKEMKESLTLVHGLRSHFSVF